MMTRPKQDPIVNGAGVVENANSFVEEAPQGKPKGPVDADTIMDSPLEWLNCISLPIGEMSLQDARKELEACRLAIGRYKSQEERAATPTAPIDPVPVYPPRMKFLLEYLVTAAGNILNRMSIFPSSLVSDELWEELTWGFNGASELHDSCSRRIEAEAKKRMLEAGIPMFECIRFGASRSGEPVAVMLAKTAHNAPANDFINEQTLVKLTSTAGDSSLVRITKTGSTFTDSETRKPVRYWYIRVVDGYNPAGDDDESED